MTQFDNTDNSTVDESTNQPLDIIPTQEVRFAVVMYGGVSLAIYMNGVTQELFEMVKATAPSNSHSQKTQFTSSQLTGSGRVYRKLGQLLGSRLSATDKETTLADIEANPHTPISTRFIIDILSGTSAGGINAIFLAKALANDQSIKGLKDLWINEGDIGKLINDSESLKGLQGFKLKPTPESLLNSERMYIKLLEALDQMESTKSSKYNITSPYVNELDLYVTATNIRGQSVPIQLADKTVYERLHRQVFHFVFSAEESGGRNDFKSPNDPFLAFCARSTSAFPLAFEPMTLQDAEDILIKLGRYNAKDAQEWEQQFFQKYEQSNRLEKQTNSQREIPFNQQAFGDGGYLDNKPFSYAIDEILRHSSEVPVNRKLIYIDPSPKHPEFIQQPKDKPNVIENSVAALLTLPRYETIREDIERVIQHNRLIERVLRITNDWQLERDIDSFQSTYNLESQDDTDWENKSLKEMIIRKGISYGGYHRLRVSAVTDDLAKLLTTAAGFNQESAEFVAIRCLIREWRKEHYYEANESSQNQGKEFENKFLHNFDWEYNLRKLYFLRRKINELYRICGTSRKNIKIVDNRYIIQKPPKQAKQNPQLISDKLPLNTPEQEQEFRQELQRIKSKLIVLIKQIIDFKRCLQTPGSKNTTTNNLVTDDKIIHFHKSVQAINISGKDLKNILDDLIEIDQEYRYKNQANKAKELLNDKRHEINEMAQQLASIFAEGFEKVKQECHQLLDNKSTSDLEPAALARNSIFRYFNYYLDYDIVTFPILYGTGVNETEQVDIIRISPEDATTLIDEKDKAEKRRKLAGNAFFGFGGFLKREWRQNDILWGRLDGSERLISALLPGDKNKDTREQLIKEAQKAILEEELKTQDRQVLLDLLSQTIASIEPSNQSEKNLREFVKEQLQESNLESKLKLILSACLDDEKLWSYFKEKNNGYEVDRQLAPEFVLRSTARSTEIIGKMIDGLAKQQGVNIKRISFWITSLAKLLWGLGEIAVPGSIWKRLLDYWLQLFYLAEILLIIGGFFLQNHPVSIFGLQTLGITLLINLAVWLFGVFIQQRFS